MKREQETFQHQNISSWRSDFKDSDNLLGKGGIALHYQMRDLWHGYPVEEERPISPSKYTMQEIEEEDKKDRKIREYQPNKKIIRKNRSSTSQNKTQGPSMKQLIKRDKIMAKKQKRVDSGLGNKSNQNNLSNPHTVQTYDESLKSSHNYLKQKNLGETTDSRRTRRTRINRRNEHSEIKEK